MKKMLIRDKLQLNSAAKDMYRHVLQEIAFAKKGQKAVVFCSEDRKVSSRCFPLRLAAAVAEDDLRIVVVNGDAQPSCLETGSEKVGLTHYLSGHCELEDLFFETDIPHVDMIPVGRDFMNPLLLEDSGLQKVFSACRERYDWMLVNTAPLSENSIGALAFAQLSDGAVLIAKDHATHRKWMKAAKEVLDQVGCPVEGCVVIDAKKKKAYSRP